MSGVTRASEAYGRSARQRGQWWLPGTSTGPLPLVVLVHGGYWREQYDHSLEDDVAQDLAERGFLVWNIDYAPSTEPWPQTLLDVAAAYDHGVSDARVDTSRVAVVGHSAGGHLALWLASRGRLPADAPGAGARVRPALAVPQSPVASLAEAHRLGLGSGAVQALVGGGPGELPDRYAVADPVALAPSGVPTVIVHGVEDDVVPLSQSTDYVAVSPSTRLVTVPGGHFTHLDPGSEAWRSALEALTALLDPATARRELSPQGQHDRD